MSDQFQRVEPTPFSAAEPAPAASTAATAEGGRPAWLMPALGGLLVLALAVFFVLPALVGDPAPPAAPAARTGSEAGTVERGLASASEADTAAGAAPSPFADAVEAKARAAAQDVLAELLDVQENLVERGAEDWAAEEMAAVAAAAEAGDELYRTREFDAALTAYEGALADALALEQSLPARFDAQLEALREAIEAFDLEAAATAAELAAQLEAAHPRLEQLNARRAALPDVIAAAAAAADAEEAGDLETAVASMGEAATLDGDHEYVAQELARLELALNDARFAAAMSEGYAALDAEQFDRAQQRFERAAGLRSGSAEAAAALNELSVARTAATLRSLKAQGEQQLADENWTAAIDSFEEALAIDASLRFAREGLALAKPRAALAAELNAILDDPGRLVDDAILREAEESVARAADIENPGPKLSEQIRRARETLRIARTPVEVTLRSDGLTAVTVYKVARLGQFAERDLTLRPGKYTAVGTRRGFRDVRREFTVTSSGLAAPVTIVCSETI